MTVPVPSQQSIQINCHHCTRWIGESRTPLTFAGMFKEPQDRSRIDEPRDTYRCKSCGWVNVFREERRSKPDSWKDTRVHGEANRRSPPSPT